MNSFLQNIFHLKNFTDFILKMDNEDQNDGFIFNLQNIFFQMDKMKGIAVSTEKLVKSFKWDIN